MLADTSVWVDHFRGAASAESNRLARLLHDEEDVCICGIILTEILQGIRSDTQYKKTKRSLDSLIYVPTTRGAYMLAAELYSSARRNGITIRRSLDCVIAACAIENRVPLLHKDKDFNELAKVSKLKLVCVGS